MEIPIEIQAEHDGTFLNEFASQPSAGQVLSKSEGSDTDDGTCVDEFASQPSAGQVLLSSERVLPVLIVLIHSKTV